MGRSRGGGRKGERKERKGRRGKEGVKAGWEKRKRKTDNRRGERTLKVVTEEGTGRKDRS